MGSPNRQLLADGWLVLKLSWSRGASALASDMGRWLAFATGESATDVPAEQETIGVLWAHVGTVLFSPYRPAFQVLRQVVAQRDEQSYIWLQATGEFIGEKGLVAKMGTNLQWAIQVFKLASSSKPVGKFDPATVPVVVVDGQAEEHLWPPKRRSTRPTQKRRRIDESAASSHDQRPEPDKDLDGEPLSDHDSDAAHDDAGAIEADEADVDIAPEVDDRGQFADLLDMFDASLLARERAQAERPPLEQDADRQNALNSDSDSDKSEAPPSPAASSAKDLGDGRPGSARPSAAPASPGVASAGGASSVIERTTALAEVQVDGGKLCAYRNGNFVAYCQNPSHGRCILTRAQAGGRRPAQGRPCGLLKAWLAMSVDAGVTSNGQATVPRLRDPLDAPHRLGVGAWGRCVVEL